MSTVCAAPLLLSLVYLDVRYVKRIHIQAFQLEKNVHIKIKVVQQVMIKEKVTGQTVKMYIHLHCSQHS